MPSYPTAFRSRPGPRRRSLLTGAAGVASAALVTGCSDSAAPDAAERPSAVRRLRARAAEESTRLLRRYDAVLAAHPSLAERLDPLRAEVERHVEAFRDGRTPAPSSSATAPGAAGPSPSVPADPDEAVRGLARAERELADRRGKALLDASDEQARLLASVAAAGAAHAYLLTEDDK
ncbi:Lipoprotein OS=Streptomyces alboniger OX=132473 GN=CP975_26265 PE=4 SV=1 [Streptomyces alboniger]